MAEASSPVRGTGVATSSVLITPDKRDEDEKQYDSDGCEINTGSMDVPPPPVVGEVRTLLITNGGYDNFWFSFEPEKSEKGKCCRKGSEVACPFASIHLHGGNRYGFCWNTKCESYAIQYYTHGMYDRLVQLAPAKFPVCTCP